jgi:pyrimidine deaminase RibD-like protein
VQSGIKHVVIVLLDPDPRNSGQGVQRLENVGVTVEVGLCCDKVSIFLGAHLGKS